MRKDTKLMHTHMATSVLVSMGSTLLDGVPQSNVLTALTLEGFVSILLACCCGRC